MEPQIHSCATWKLPLHRHSHIKQNTDFFLSTYSPNIRSWHALTFLSMSAFPCSACNAFLIPNATLHKLHVIKICFQPCIQLTVRKGRYRRGKGAVGHKNFELSMERVITFLDHMRGRVTVFCFVFFVFLQKMHLVKKKRHQRVCFFFEDCINCTYLLSYRVWQAAIVILISSRTLQVTKQMWVTDCLSKQVPFKTVKIMIICKYSFWFSPTIRGQCAPY